MSEPADLYLKCMSILSFGAISHRVIGPLSPHLNVVHGKNETGKTTVNAFFGGVLFGWEDARGIKNTYKPINAQRAGSLFFADRTTGAEFELSRVKNVDGLCGKGNVLEDIDKETFQTMFALNSDELRSLRNTTDVTAKLLTAGSGTSASPAHALLEIHNRIAEYTSRASGIEHSLVQLTAQLEELHTGIAQAADEAERFKQQDKEFHELATQRKTFMAKQQELNNEIEELAADRASFEKIEAELVRSIQRRDELLDEERIAASAHKRQAESFAGDISITAAEEHAMRDHIDMLFEEQSKREHRIDLARDNCTVSKAGYEALIETGELRALEEKVKSQRRIQVVLSVALPLLFVFVGVLVFLHGREISSLSFTALGIGLVVFAFFLAGAALVMLFRPNKVEEALSQRKQDAKWVMLQDQKKFEACEEDLSRQRKNAMDYLGQVGLAEAQGSLRRARTLLDEAKEARVESGLIVQKQQALASQLSSIEDAIARVQQQKEALLVRQLLPFDTQRSHFDALIEQKTQQRTSLLEMSENVNRRYGEIKQELTQAKHLKRFDELKLAHQQVKTRIKESSRDLARLLLAKRMLEASIAAWESKSQPEVYRQASRLLERMTAGVWVQVRMSEEGRLQVVDQVKMVREPVHLSLGTCQQLYLSLRIALLMTADNVGRAIPIMADDILVNFDEDRRRGAAEALLELSAKRQVVLFTCHEEIVRLMQDVDSQLNLVEL